MDEKKERNVIYTTVISTKNAIDIPKNFEKMKNWDYILFTNLDKNIFSNTPWTVVNVNKEFPCNIMSARYIKWVGNELLNSYDNLVWIDAYIILDNEKEEEFNNIINSNNIVFKEHPFRKCIYDECNAVIVHNKDTKFKVSINKGIFIREKMPKKYGLIETNIIMYKNTTENREFFKKVFTFMVNKSHRDQLSLTYNIWKYNFKNFKKLPYDYIKSFIKSINYSNLHNMSHYNT